MRERMLLLVARSGHNVSTELEQKLDTMCASSSHVV